MKSFFRLPNIIGTLPVTLTNGTVADATQVMSDLSWIVNQTNANAAPLSGTALTNANNNFTVVQSGVAATSGTNFPLASQVQNNVFNTLTSTLGTNTITARVAALPLSAWAVGQVFTFIPTNPNNGSVTVAPDGLGSGVLNSLGQQLVGGELGSGTAMVRVASAGAMPVLDLLNPRNVPLSAFTAAGDIVQGAGAALVARLGIGVLGTRLHSTGTAAEWQGTWFKVGTFTRDTSLANGTAAITGVGFTPKLVIFLAATTGGINNWGASIGMDDGTTHEVLGLESANTWTANGSTSIDFFDGAGGSCRGSISAIGSDGFTINYTKGGAPTATLTIYYLAFR